MGVYERIYCFNGPFYRYNGHIESIRFNEYYGMPRGTIRFSLSFMVFHCIFLRKKVRYQRINTELALWCYLLINTAILTVRRSV